MKPTSLLFILTFLSLILVGCDQKSSKKSSSSNPYGYDCNLYPTALGCPGYTGGVAGGVNCTLYPTSYGCPGYTGGAAGGTTGGAVNCSTQLYLPYCNAGYVYYANMCASNKNLSYCSGFCTYYPSAPSCSSSTTGGTTGDNNNYGSLYPQGVPSGSCQDATGSGFDTRRATMTIVGGSWMNPASVEASSYLNTSSELTSYVSASNFISAGTDALVKVRLKVKEQPVSAQTTGTCYNRTTGSSIPGYTKLRFTLSIAPKSSPSTIKWVGDYEVGVNSCTSAIDLSGWKQNYPDGFFVIISNVLSNQECSGSYYTTNGYSSCNVWGPVRTKDCWRMELEVAVDGSKTF